MGVDLSTSYICMNGGLCLKDLFLEFTSWHVAYRSDVVYIWNNIFLLNRICDSEFKSRKGNDSNGFLEVQFSSQVLQGKNNHSNQIQKLHNHGKICSQRNYY